MIIMSESALLAAGVYVILGRWLIHSRIRGRDAVFTLLNLTTIYYLFIWGKTTHFPLLLNLLVGLYLALICAQYFALRKWSERPGWLPWLAFLMPIGILAAVRYSPLGFLSRLFNSEISEQRHLQSTVSLAFTGISYLAFRTSYLVLEVRNGIVGRPGLWEYLNFAFFAPTLSVGPISPYSQHRRAFDETERPDIPVLRALLRVLVGAVKYAFFGPLLNRLTYSGLLLDGHPHLWVDLPIAAVSYYLYLYCNFSGFCDVAIGGAGLMGVAVAENFNNPFAARNVKDFWNRWHITLSHYMRDVVFSPLSKALVRAFGPGQANQAIALTILVVFLIVGVWHGVGWNYAAFGAMHAVGVVSNHYYTIMLKRWLRKDQLAAYHRNRPIQATAVTLTFAYVVASMFLFANDRDAMKQIVSILRIY